LVSMYTKYDLSLYNLYAMNATQMEGKPKLRPNPDSKLLDQVREVLRYYHYAYRTESTYCQWT